MGTYHSTRNFHGQMVQNFLVDCTGVENLRPFRSQFCPQKLKMANSLELLFALEIFSDSEFIIDKLMVDDDDIIVLSAIGWCYMLRNLNRIYNFMEITLLSYLPDEFKSHYRMTRETCDLFAQEAMRRGREGYPSVTLQEDLPFGKASIGLPVEHGESRACTGCRQQVQHYHE